MAKSQERLEVSVLAVANCNLFSSKLEFAGLQIRVFLNKNCSLDIVKLPQTTFCHSDDPKGGRISRSTMRDSWFYSA